MFERLRDRGFEIEFLSHPEAILDIDFQPAVPEFEDALLAAAIPIEEIIGVGGGEAEETQRLRRALAAAAAHRHTGCIVPFHESEAALAEVGASLGAATGGG